MRESFCVILTTAGSEEEAARLAELLVSGRLAACVQVASVASTYMWKDQLRREPEHLVLIKTRARLYAAVEKAIIENHSYETPEIIQLRVDRGLDRYLDWISNSTAPAGAA
jgi:periplasmic divalent cation tolerance protein